jgi:hypothetical protein
MSAVNLCSSSCAGHEASTNDNQKQIPTGPMDARFKKLRFADVPFLLRPKHPGRRGPLLAACAPVPNI